MTPNAFITEHEVIEKILTHLRLPLTSEVLSDGQTVAYDITGEPILDDDRCPGRGDHWERGPPQDCNAWEAPPGLQSRDFKWSPLCLESR